MINKIDKPKIGISTCLLGENVRYNAGHKLDHYLKDVLGQFVEFIPICPEVEAGFGIPREAVHLKESENGIEMITEKSNLNLTEQMNNWTVKKCEEIKKMNLCGYIFKSKSPSCGVYRTRVYRDDIGPSLNGRGLFAKYIIDQIPTLTFEEEGRLHDPIIRDNFIQNIFINHRWNNLIESKTLDRLIKFHQSLKYTLMSHSPKLLKNMGHLVATCNKDQVDLVYQDYLTLLKKSLLEFSDRKKNKNVLEHIMGYFKKDLAKDEKVELKELIDNYYNGLLPLIVPISLLNHYVRKYDQDYLKGQFYLNPHPLELMLRNHV